MCGDCREMGSGGRPSLGGISWGMRFLREMPESGEHVMQRTGAAEIRAGVEKAEAGVTEL